MKLFNIKLPKVIAILFVCISVSACGEKPENLLTSAKDYLAKNDTKAAVIQIKNALQSSPDLPEGRFLLGSALIEEGDFVGAETELRKALDLKFPKDRVIPQLVKSLLAQGKSKKIIDDFSRVELSLPDAKASLKMSLTSAYAREGQLDNSQASLDAALLADPRNAPARLVLARQKAGKGDMSAALDLTDAVIRDAPGSFDAWLLKGDIFLYDKKNEADALAAYKKSIEINPKFLAGQTAVITLLMHQGDFGGASLQISTIKKLLGQHPQVTLLEGQLAFRKQDFKAAKYLSQQVLAAAPLNFQALQLAGVVALQLGSWDQAEEYLTQAVKVAPDFPMPRRALVQTFLRSGQPAKALAALQYFLDREIADADLLSLAGEVYLQNGDVKKAEVYFRQASDKSPNDGKKKTSVAVTHLVSGQVDVALNELQTISASDEGVSADLALISVNLKRKAFDQALKAIDSLEKKQPGKPLSAQLRGRTLVAKNDIAGARQSFERALEIEPTYFPAVSSLAALDMLALHPENAKKRFEALLSKSPKNSAAFIALAEIAIRSGAGNSEVATLLDNAVKANPTDVAARLLQVDFYLRINDLKASVSAAQNAVSVLPESAEILTALGRSQMASGEINQAIASYTKLSSLQPSSPLPYMYLADAYNVTQNKEAFAQSLQKAIAIKSDFRPAQRAFILLDMYDKNYPRALTTARTIQKQGPKEALGYALEADIYVVQKKWGDALSVLRGGLKLLNSPELAMKLHAVLLDSGQTSEADKFSATWQKDNPKDALFLFYLGDSALSRNDFVSAENIYLVLLKFQPANAVVYNNLAWASFKLGKAGAIAYAEKANTLLPNQPAFLDTLAALLSSKGDYAKALELQNKALALQPKNALYKLNLAKIYIKSGKKDLARKELEDLRKLGDKFSDQSEVSLLLGGV
jgi:putative PEP-CTERM system TPR-repeat lipoprotein